MARLGLKLFSVSVLIAALILLPACSGKNKDSQSKKPMSSQQKTKTPAEMKTMLSDLDKLMAALDQKIKMDKTSTLQQSTQTAAKQPEQQGQGQQGQKGQEGQQNQQGQQNKQGGGGQGQQGQQQNQMAGWQKEDTALKSIHLNWNKLEPDAVKAGLSTTEQDSFEKALEDLTLAVSQQKKEESLQAAIELYGQYANLARVFKMPIPPAYFQLKYEIMTSATEAGRKDWSKAQEHITKIQDYWNHLKVQAQVKDEKLMSRTEFSLQDVEQALKNQLLDTLLIKTEIALKNLLQLEKALSSSSSGQS